MLSKCFYQYAIRFAEIRITLLVLISLVLTACQTVPNDETVATEESEALYLQANKSLTAGKTDMAIQQFEQVVKSNPSAKHAYTNLGLLYMAKHESKQAKQAFINAIEQDKNDAVAYNNLAVIQRQDGQFQKALLNYNSAIKLDKNYANAYLNLGILYDIYLQDLPKAVEQYEQYQRLTKGKNKDVDKWLVDTKRRIDTKNTGGK